MGSPSPPSNPYTYGPQANNIYGTTLNANLGLAKSGSQYTNNILQNPFASGYQTAASSAGELYGSLSPQASGASANLYGAGNEALSAGNSVLQTGFDPQNALYARTQNQQEQQTGALLASTGVGATPYGASVEAQNNSNFNIDWQNNELQRQISAIQGFGSASGTAAGDYAAGGAQGQLGASSALQAGSVPYDVNNSINSTKLGALGTQQGLFDNAQSGAANYLQSSFGAQQQTYQDQLQQSQALWQGIGGIAGLFGGSSFGNAISGFGGGGSSGGGSGGLFSMFGNLFGGGSDPWSGAGVASDGLGW